MAFSDVGMGRQQVSTQTGGTAVKLRAGIRAVAAAVAVLLVAGACGASGDAGVETPSATSAPPPAEPAPEPAEPPADPDPPPPPEAPPPEPALQPAPEEPAAPPEAPEETAAPPEAPEGAAEAETPAAEPPAQAEPGDEPATPADPSDAPAAAPESQDTSGEPLDEATVAALAARLVAAQATVTSQQMSMFMSIAASFPGEPAVDMADVPLMTITEMGDLSHVKMDMAGLFGDDPDAAPPDTPTLEMILEGETGLYLRLESLAASDPMPEPWLAELAAEYGDDFGDLWGFADLTGVDGADALAFLGMSSQTTIGEDFIELMADGLPEGALLEARQIGRGEVAGTETEGYSFVLDLATLSEWPEALGMIFGDSPDGAGAAADDFLGALSGSMPVEYIVHVDSDDIIRRLLVVVDLGAILSQVFGELALDDGLPEGAEGMFAEFEYVMSMRTDVTVVNDPSLVVELPDPSLVVDLPDPALEGDLS